MSVYPRKDRVYSRLESTTALSSAFHAALERTRAFPQRKAKGGEKNGLPPIYSAREPLSRRALLRGDKKLAARIEVSYGSNAARLVLSRPEPTNFPARPGLRQTGHEHCTNSARKRLERTVLKVPRERVSRWFRTFGRIGKSFSSRLVPSRFQYLQFLFLQWPCISSIFPTPSGTSVVSITD